MKTIKQLAALLLTLSLSGNAVADTFNSSSDGPWMDATVWATPPTAGDTNIWRLGHEVSGGLDFLGDTLVITGTGSLDRTIADMTDDWNVNNLIIESGGQVMGGSSNRKNHINGKTIELQDGAILTATGRDTSFNFDTWQGSASAIVQIFAENAEFEMRDGPGDGTTDTSSFLGTLKVTNTQGGAQPDIQIFFDIPADKASFKMHIEDRDATAGSFVIPTKYELRNGLNQSFTEFAVHRVRLSTDIDTDGRYDPDDGDILEVADISIPAGVHNLNDLSTIDSRLSDVFLDQGDGTGTITVGSGPVHTPVVMTGATFDGTTATATWNAEPNQRYFVYSSTDLVNWQELEDSASSPTGSATYIDMIAERFALEELPVPAQAFYRVIENNSDN